MTENMTYLNSTIRERTPDGPFLLDGEELVYQTKVGMTPFDYLWCIIFLFIPPFVIFGVLMFLFSYWRKKNSVIWVTNKRVVSANKIPFSNFSVASIPINHITLVQRRFKTAGFLDAFFKIGDIQIHIKDKILPQLYLSYIKNPREVMKAIKSVSANIVDDN